VQFVTRERKLWGQVADEPSHTITITIESSQTSDTDAHPGEKVETKDNFESFPFADAEMLAACGNYKITYTDQRGLKTEREIDVKRVHKAGGSYAIDAHCRMRNGHRSFIDSRIEKAIDLVTGEVVDKLAEHAISQYENSAAGKTWTAIQKEFAAVMIMSFVCRADGRMMKDERAIFADYLKRRHPELCEDDALLEDAIKSTGTPTNMDFKRFVWSLKAAGDYDRLDDLLDCAKRIVATQKTVDPMEAAAIEIIEAAARRCHALDAMSRQMI